MASHLLVGNPTAQSGKNAERIERARAWLTRAGIETDFLATLPGGKTIPAVTQALDAGGYTCAVYMGGDGTFREVASGILASARREDVALGMLPTGTANDQGRSFGLDAGEAALEKNLEVVRAGKETRLDAGRIVATSGDATEHTALFFDSAGWGISARVLAERNKDRSWIQENVPLLGAVYRDQLVYAGAALRVFLESYVVSEKFTAHAKVDGESYTLEGLTDLVVKGTRIYGGAWVFDRTSAHDDGLFELVPFRGKRDWTSKAIVDLDGNPLGEDVLNQVGIEHSKPLRGRRFELVLVPAASGSPLHAQIDGEEWLTTSHVTIDVLPRALRLVVP
jgi:diacylglycerol kinase family enzyme